MKYDTTIAPFIGAKGAGYWCTDGQVTWFTKYKIPLIKDKSWSYKI